MIESGRLKSRVVETSLDGGNWTETDRRTDNDDLKDEPCISSFTVSKPTECRFIRVTQTGDGRDGSDALFIDAVEFFGVLLE
jgi:hypothetical protein